MDAAPLGELAPSHPEIERVVAPNPGPMTLTGTNTYLVGRDPAWVVDPGPADEGHVDTIREAGERRGGIGGAVLTHSHVDHSAAVPLLDAPLRWGKVGVGDETAGKSGAGARASAPGEVGPFRVLPTPGHAADHVCFLFGRVCFCGDLILGEGSSFVPPDGGSLVGYLDSLHALEGMDLDLLCPGHGPWIIDPAAKVAEYIDHRLDRERKLVATLEAGERSRAKLLAAAWDDVPAPMRPAAAVVMQAHLEKLAAEGRLPNDLTE